MFGEKILSVSADATAVQSDAKEKTPPSFAITSKVSYSEEEKMLLLSNLTEGQQHEQQKKQEEQTEERLNNDTKWTETTLPLLVSMVKKVLELALNSYKDDVNATRSTCLDNETTKNDILSVVNLQTTGKIDNFIEENNYIVEQLEQQQWPFFSLPRLWEILSDPFIYNTSATGNLRGEKLQAAVRRCVLVSTPLFGVQPSFFMSPGDV